MHEITLFGMRQKGKIEKRCQESNLGHTFDERQRKVYFSAKLNHQ